MNQLPFKRFSPVVICALIGGFVPLVFVDLAESHAQFQMPIALFIAIFPFAIPFAFVASAFNPGTPLISVLPLIALAAAFNAGYFALVASVVAWGWRRLSERSRRA